MPGRALSVTCGVEQSGAERKSWMTGGMPATTDDECICLALAMPATCSTLEFSTMSASVLTQQNINHLFMDGNTPSQPFLVTSWVRHSLPIASYRTQIHSALPRNHQTVRMFPYCLCPPSSTSSRSNLRSSHPPDVDAHLLLAKRSRL